MINKLVFSYIRKLDIYVLKSFLSVFVISIFALAGLYIVIHFFTNISDFMEVTQENIFVFIPRYYLIRIPFILYKLLPIMVLIAVMMTLARLMKTRELIAMLSAGIAVYRIILPIFVAIVAIIGLMYFTDEVITPYLGRHITLTEKILKSEGSDRFIIRQSEGYRFIIKKYDYIRQEMNDVWISQYDRDNNLILQVIARKGVWSAKKDSGWLLSNGIVYSYDNAGFRKSEPQLFQEQGYLLACALTPQFIAKAEETSSYLSLTQLKATILSQPLNNSLRLQYYSKLTAPLITLVLIFLGLPFAMVRKSQSLFSGIGICLVISMGFFISRAFTEGLGNKGIMPPYLAVILPLVIFAVIGIILSKLIRT